MAKNFSYSVSKIIILFFALLLILLAVNIIFQRSYKIEYDHQADYQYQFKSSEVEVLNLIVTDNKINLDSSLIGCNTAFLELKLRFTCSGFIFLPEIIMKDDSSMMFSQNFECRVKGIRYLNISQFVSAGVKEIQLDFKGCRLHEPEVTIYAYKNIKPENAQILILSPHPDDAEIAAYGLYSSFPSNVFIATITAGDAGSMIYANLFQDTLTHYSRKGRVRAWNSITVPFLGGVPIKNSINLGYFDASLSGMHADTNSLGKSRYIGVADINLFRSYNCNHLPDSLTPMSNWRSLVNDIKYLLEDLNPKIIISPYPAIDSHLDHKFTTLALIEALKERGAFDSELWLYTNHFPEIKMHPIGKLGSQIGLPPIIDDIRFYFDEIVSFPLSKIMQSDKVLALDAMNDLRPNTQYREVLVLRRQLKMLFYDKLFLRESDYFRRSVRSNELFFVIKGESLRDNEILIRVLGDDTYFMKSQKIKTN